MESATPLWLGLIIVIIGYAINTFQKWIDITTNGEKFILKYWWDTNKLFTGLTLLVIVALLLVVPDITKGTMLWGSEMLGERLVYLLIGYAPMKLFKSIIPKQYLSEHSVEDYK